MTRQYYVYIMTNPRKTVLYTGVTNDLVRRAWQHRNAQGGGFTAKYRCSELVLYEVLPGLVQRHRAGEADQGRNSPPQGRVNRANESGVAGPVR